MEIWNIGLASWIIQDGNYPDFAKGQVAEFALQFSIVEGEFSQAGLGDVHSCHLYGSSYHVNAKVVYVDQDLWILDFGLLAYGTNPPEGITVGMTISANILLEIDYYLYFESLSKNDNIPPLIYSWTVEQILLGTKEECGDSGRAGYSSWKGTKQVSPVETSYIDLSNTDAWNDDHGYAEYLLLVKRMDIAGKRYRTN
jgi:hypothetical protein